jgi:hypothetical protein
MTCHPIRQWPAAGALAVIVALPGCGSDKPKTAAAKTTPAPAATSMSTPAPSAPASLRGHWKRTMTAHDWKAAGGGFPAGTFRLTVDDKGGVDVYFPRTKTVDFSTQFVAAGRRMTVDTVPICPGVKGSYRWRASARTMTLTVVSDAKCAPRAALFGGTWRRQ